VGSRLQHSSWAVAPASSGLLCDICLPPYTQGRYLFLNALANQLRYPNSHTHYFSCVLLFLFSEAQQVSPSLPCLARSACCSEII
jgi:CCR4-Not complex component, Not1